MGPLEPGSVVWVAFDEGQGREQSGLRPAIVVSSMDHLLATDDLMSVLPATTTEKGWPNHVPLRGPTGLERTTFAMTEQTKTVSRTRIVEISGAVDEECLAEIMGWVGEWLHLPRRREGPGRFARR
jgi:mRNA interferase MazF